MYDGRVNDCYEQRLKNNFLDTASVGALIILALNFFKISKLLEIIEVKKTKQDTKAVSDLKINNDDGEGGKDQCDPAEHGIAEGKAADRKADHQDGKKAKKFFSDRNLPLAHVAYAGLVSLIRFHVLSTRWNNKSLL